jgi:hypothetical protein
MSAGSHTPVPRAPTYQRHALGLPAGSIRALLAFGILGYLWLLGWLLERLPPQENKEQYRQASLTFIYLQFLMVLILAHFFTAHGHTIGSQVSERSPLGLPRGSVRFLLLAGYLGLVAWLYHSQTKFEIPETGPVVVLLLVLVGAFFLGHVLTAVVRTLSRGILPAWFQDIQAWLAILALLLLGIVLLIRLVINTSVPLERQIGLGPMEATLAGLVGFYFGARS